MLVRGHVVTSELVLAELRRQDFVVLSTVDDQGRPHSAGVSYGVSPPGAEFAIYVMTRRHLRKARDIARNPSVSLVVPLPRRLLWFLPPAIIQLTGRVEILEWTDETERDVLSASAARSVAPRATPDPRPGSARR